MVLRDGARGHGANLRLAPRQTETDNNTYERPATEDQVLSSASTSVAWYNTFTSDLWAAATATFKPQVTTSSGGGGSSATAMYAATPQLLVEDYYPYGSARISQATGSFNE